MNGTTSEEKTATTESSALTDIINRLKSNIDDPIEFFSFFKNIESTVESVEQAYYDFVNIIQDQGTDPETVNKALDDLKGYYDKAMELVKSNTELIADVEEVIEDVVDVVRSDEDVQSVVEKVRKFVPCAKKVIIINITLIIVLCLVILAVNFLTSKDQKEQDKSEL